MTETLGWEFSSESFSVRAIYLNTKHAMVYMVFKNLYICVLRSRVALALEGLKAHRHTKAI